MKLTSFEQLPTDPSVNEPEHVESVAKFQQPAEKPAAPRAGRIDRRQGLDAIADMKILSRAREELREATRQEPTDEQVHDRALKMKFDDIPEEELVGMAMEAAAKDLGENGNEISGINAELRAKADAQWDKNVQSRKTAEAIKDAMAAKKNSGDGSALKRAA